MGTCRGPMFEPAKTDWWESSHGKQGGHYNTFHLAKGVDGMEVLRGFFSASGFEVPDEMNFVLFSTSGVHGSYTTIEAARATPQRHRSGQARYR